MSLRLQSLSHCASGMSRKPPPRMAPALLPRTSMRPPPARLASSTTRATSASCERSAPMATASFLLRARASLASLSSAALSRATATTRAPSSAIPSVIARPMPRLAPVTTTTLSLSSRFIRSPLCRSPHCAAPERAAAWPRAAGAPPRPSRARRRRSRARRGAGRAGAPRLRSAASARRRRCRWRDAASRRPPGSRPAAPPGSHRSPPPSGARAARAPRSAGPPRRASPPPPAPHRARALPTAAASSAPRSPVARAARAAPPIVPRRRPATRRAPPPAPPARAAPARRRRPRESSPPGGCANGAAACGSPGRPRLRLRRRRGNGSLRDERRHGRRRRRRRTRRGDHASGRRRARQTLRAGAGQEIVDRALGLAKPADDVADPERDDERAPEGHRAQEGGAEGQGAAVQRHHADARRELAERLARDRVQHGRIRDREHEREEHHAALEAAAALDAGAPAQRGHEAEHELRDHDHDAVDQERDEPDPEARGVRRPRSHAVHGAYNTRMISVRDGQAQILARIGAPLAPELVPLTRALGRVLADDFAAPFDVPPADNSAVDGYAVGSADMPAGGTRDLVVIADLAAGSVFEGKLGAGQALRIMTGAPMPAGADAVYPQEVVQREGDHVRVGPIDRGANVRLAGEDVEMGEVVVEAGTVLRPQEIGLLASLGAWQVAVRRRPRVALLSTGDEVAEPGTPRRPGQIYDANRFTLRGSIEQCGGEVIDLGIVPDVRDTLRASLEDAARAADVVVSSRR